MSKPNRYDDEFKKMIVDLVQSGRSITSLSSEYGISTPTIYKWVNLYKPISTSNGEVTSNKEIAKMKKEIARIKMENEILKKAIAIFTKE